jgi:hypothetical protein
MSATQLAEAIRTRQVSSVEVVEAHLRRIEAPGGPVPGRRGRDRGPVRHDHPDRPEVTVRTMSTSIDRLTSLDRLMLAASRRWPQDIGALAILYGTSLFDPAGELPIDVVREAIASRLHLVPRFRQVIHVPRRGLGGPLWVDAAHFDVRDHVLIYPLASETDEPGLLAVTEALRRQRFDPSSSPRRHRVPVHTYHRPMTDKLHRAHAGASVLGVPCEACLTRDLQTFPLGTTGTE